MTRSSAPLFGECEGGVAVELELPEVLPEVLPGAVD